MKLSIEAELVYNFINDTQVIARAARPIPTRFKACVWKVRFKCLPAFARLRGRFLFCIELLVLMLSSANTTNQQLGPLGRRAFPSDVSGGARSLGARNS